MVDEWVDKNGDIYGLDPDAPEGVVRYIIIKKAEKEVKKSNSKKKVKDE